MDKLFYKSGIFTLFVVYLLSSVTFAQNESVESIEQACTLEAENIGLENADDIQEYISACMEEISSQTNEDPVIEMDVEKILEQNG